MTTFLPALTPDEFAAALAARPEPDPLLAALDKLAQAAEGGAACILDCRQVWAVYRALNIRPCAECGDWTAGDVLKEHAEMCPPCYARACED